MTTAIFKAYRWYLVLLLLLWLPALWAGLSRDPNPFTVLVVDRWVTYLPALSIAVVLLAIARRCQIKIVFYLSVIILVLVIISMINISIWFSISVENRTAQPLTAVSVDLQNNRTRRVSIGPQQKRLVALTEAGSLEIAKGRGYHVLVYDSAGKIYYDNTLLPEELERLHLITIGDSQVQSETKN